MNKDDLIYIAGHSGFVGTALVNKLKQEGYENLLTEKSSVLDLSNKEQVDNFLKNNKPNIVILCAAKVGGVKDKASKPYEYLFDNLSIQNNVIDASVKNGVKKLLFLASAVAYPENAKQPLCEEYLFEGKVEATNEPYANAKLIGIKLCEYARKQYGANFISCVPTNLYGEGDSFDPQKSHVIPSLIRKMHEAKINNLSEITVFGSGNAKREFMHVNDLVDSIFWLMDKYNDSEPINLGTGKATPIKELANTIKDVVGYDGNLVFDTSVPDGPAIRQLDTAKINNLGWNSKISLEEGLVSTYDWFLENN